MKKQIKVIRSANQTIVIYKDPPKEKGAVSEPVITQKPVPVYQLGRLAYFVMPNGRCYPARMGFWWKVLKLIRPRSRFVAV